MIAWIRKHTFGAYMTIGAGWLVLGGSYLVTSLIESDGHWPAAVVYLGFGVVWVVVALLSRVRSRSRQKLTDASSRD
ncbi:hypothetical protein [Leifsonia sp. NPDC058248]|uniref:hypothetical protein n=1 Tax=Leifsonia sp. NPDC058248 TaxID=3346402 RepID=UPI0036D866E7